MDERILIAKSSDKKKTIFFSFKLEIAPIYQDNKKIAIKAALLVTKFYILVNGKLITPLSYNNVISIIKPLTFF